MLVMVTVKKMVMTMVMIVTLLLLLPFVYCCLNRCYSGPTISPCWSCSSLPLLIPPARCKALALKSTGFQFYNRKDNWFAP